MKEPWKFQKILIINLCLLPKYSVHFITESAWELQAGLLKCRKSSSHKLSRTVTKVLNLTTVWTQALDSGAAILVFVHLPSTPTTSPPTPSQLIKCHASFTQTTIHWEHNADSDYICRHNAILDANQLYTDVISRIFSKVGEEKKILWIKN